MENANVWVVGPVMTAQSKYVLMDVQATELVICQLIFVNVTPAGREQTAASQRV